MSFLWKNTMYKSVILDIKPILQLAENNNHTTKKMKFYFIIASFFLVCSCQEKSAQKWMKEAHCTDSISIVSPDKIANINELKLKGLTLEQVESLYGHYHEVAFENRQIKSPMDLQKISDGEFARLFTNEDYPMYISALRRNTYLSIQKTHKCGNLQNA